jgi:glucoamylase
VGNSVAPGHPGSPPRWTSSAKSGVGTAISGQSRVWFTISHGIVNEVYYPRIDQANTRDFGLLVADGSQFFSEEKRDATSAIVPLAQGVPAYRVVNSCNQGRYRITKVILADSLRDVLLQSVQFEALQGRIADYQVYALLAPHIGNAGYGNTGWTGEYKGVPMLFAQRGDTTLALASSVGFCQMSCGYLGVSDGWQDISKHKRMCWSYTDAPDGNIALTGAVDVSACDGRFLLALAFGRNPAEAGQRARASLLDRLDLVAERYQRSWETFQGQCLDLGEVGAGGFDLYRVSTAVLKTHEAKNFHGGMIASLSVPWGFAKGDDDLGGYHLAWPRDLVESAGGLLAAGDKTSARQALRYLMSTQEAEGFWPQNMWLDGTAYWNGVQMDETAFPILLVDALQRARGLSGLDPWPMVRRAAAFLVCNGPVTQQDRWEEDGGYSPFTLAVEVAALLIAADCAQHAGEAEAARYLRETADTWNQCIEPWTYVRDTELTRQLGVSGYYVRIAPVDAAEAASCAGGFVPIKNRPPGQSSAPSASIVSPDAIALVRFGLRAPDDPRIANTIRVIDAMLKTETSTGPVWHRYNEDGYGEQDDGGAFDGTGTGRGWPLLAGERAHYELALGNPTEARRLCGVMAAQSSPGGLIPEQVWDAADIPALELFNGHPSGSAMPLVWAHAEYIKLLRSLRDGRVFDTPPVTVQRYQVDNVRSPFAFWRFSHKCRRIPLGSVLRVEVLAPALIHWSCDEWRTSQDTETTDSHLGMHFADLPVAALPAGSVIRFTIYWTDARRWEGSDFEIAVGHQRADDLAAP